MEVFRLLGSVFIDNEKADRALDETDKKGKGLASTLSSGIATAAKFGAAIGAAAIAGGTAIVGLATKVGNAADRLLDLQAITGMTTDEIQRWERVAKVAGVSTEAVTNASQKLTRQFAAMDTEGNKSRQALEALGYSVREIEHMNADERMNALTRALADIEDPTERARIGTDLFAGSWKDIAPIVDMGADAMDRAKESANIIEEEDLNRANDFRIRVAEMRDQLGHFAMMLGVNVLPIAEKFFDWVSYSMPIIQNIFTVVFEAIAWLVDRFIFGIDMIMQWVRNWAADNSDQLEGMREVFMAFFEAVQNLISGFVEFAIQFWEQYGDSIISIAKFAWDVVSTVFETAFNLITDLFNIFAAIFRGDWEALWEHVQSFFGNIWDGIYNTLKATINLIIRAINGMVERLNRISFSIPDWVPVLGGRSWGFNLPTIPELADGGIIRREGMALVGEAGPELLNLPRGAQVTPLPAGGGGQVVFGRGAFEGAVILDDYGVDRLMDRVVDRLHALGIGVK